MNLGFDRDLYIQPFDHRGSFLRYTEFVHVFEKVRAS